ncbi:hypothetical protein [Mesorhizobium sp. WSM2239]|uniref:Fibronectin type-III domain-containing protein n=2 Tax=unclassified Mesorhizobium TaxID=325217 RepID=A0AAU8D356_9HYPH
MAQEYAVVCALPHSLSSQRPFQVSLFLSPTIESPEETRLDEWELFPDWAEAASGLRVELSDQQGVIECEPQLNPIKPDLWRAMFPGSVPVRAPRVSNWSARKWRSFSAKRVHDIALGMHMATVIADPANPPDPSNHPLSGDVLELARKAGCFRLRESERERRLLYDESRATAYLDEIVESRESLAVVERRIAGERDWVKHLALELHRCRRFYERPEAQWPYRPDPIPGAKPPPTPDNEPEFHARCALLGDHSELLRQLGLVIDLVADRERLRSAKWLSAALYIMDTSVSRPTRVRCHARADVFTTVSQTADWDEGALRLGDPARFSVLTLDTDGSALKADRFLWTLPRLIAIEQNGDPVNAATPAQRSPGFTVAGAAQAVRTQTDLLRQAKLADNLRRGRNVDLDTEDLVRGLRVEVWDDKSRAWHSLHKRLSTATVDGFGSVYEDHPEEGFIQGTAAHENFRATDAPVQVHEALFGWEGWSLSAPRPGKRIWEKDGEQALLAPQEPPSPDTPHPFHVSGHVENVSLPRLRYGRSYSFRAWAVDLAGNSRPHDLNPRAFGPADVSGLDNGGSAAAPADWTTSRLMNAARMALERRLERNPADEIAPVSSDELLQSQIMPEVTPHLRLRRSSHFSGRLLGAGTNRAAGLPTAVSEALRSANMAGWPVTQPHAPSDLSALIGSHVSALAPGREAESAVLKKALETVTKPQRFLRWEPISSPALVPRWRYTEGESLTVLVIRSGVTQDPTTLAIAVEEPGDYVATASAIVPKCGYHSTSQRHLAPPKVTQVQAELHGMFDLAIGSTAAVDQSRMLGWALRADGTFADRERADIDNPPEKIPQPGMSIVHVGVPTENAKNLPPLPGEPQPPAERILQSGDPPAPGQTIIHDVDDLSLPYLPDPMAKGVAIYFPEAGREWGLQFPYAVEGFTVSYGGDWPELEPFRLVVEGGAALAAKVEGRLIRMLLPPGDKQLLRTSSSLPKDKLELMGPWQFLPEAVRTKTQVAEAAADGMLWGLSPFEQITLVHAVNRPIEAPRPIRITPLRTIGSTSATLAGAVDLHGPSTGTLSVEATWEEPLDDITLPACIFRKSGGKASETIIQPDEDIALLGGSDQKLSLPDIGLVRIHRAVHEFSDNRHRVIDYTFRAFTRFREFFHLDLLKNAEGNPTDDMHSVVAPVLRVSIPSSAPPAPPIVHSVLPMFRWSDDIEPEQPMAWRRTRRAGIRLYLDRPWFSSGEGELLGVLIARGGDDSHYPDLKDGSGFPFVSKWGADPIWHARDVDRRALPMLRLDDLLRLTAVDDRQEPARPSMPPMDLPLAAIDGQPTVTVLGYTPQFNENRGLWFVDIAIDPGPQFWPFLRLAVSRYQPESISGCHLSAPVQCDFVQLPPERTAAISRTDDRHVRVLVSGPVGSRIVADDIDPSERIQRNRRLVARLQRRDPAIGSDLGWKTVSVEKLGLRGLSSDGYTATWITELDSLSVIHLSKPGVLESDWRVAIEEWELLEADDLIVTVAGHDRGVAHTERRLVYADNIAI